MWVYFVGGVCVRGWVYICLYGWDVLEGWECIGKEGEVKLHHYITLVTLSSLVHEQILSHQPDKDELNWKQKLQVFKIKRKALFTIKILFYRTLHLFPSWDDSKRARGGASHTLLTVRFITYQHHSLLPNYSAALFKPFDRRWLISFTAFVLMTQTYKKITKTEVVGLQKLKWLIFDGCTNNNPLRYTWTDPVYSTASKGASRKSPCDDPTWCLMIVLGTLWHC